MMTGTRSNWWIPAIFPILAVIAGGSTPAEILLHPGGWLFPNIVTSEKEAIRVDDRTPLIPGKETMRKGYRKRDGTFFQTYEIEGRIFGVEVDTNGKPPFEYSIMDADGDGKFESKIMHTPGNKDHAYVPEWVIDHYYAVHPDLKNRSGEQEAPFPTLNPEKPKSDPPAAKRAQNLPPPPELKDRPNP